MHAVASLSVAGRVAAVVLACALSAPQNGQAEKRDPFIPPTSSLNPRPECPGSGLAALRIEELAPSGIVHQGRRRWALLVGPDGRSHVASAGTRVCDGTVVSVGTEAISFEPLADPSDRRPRRSITKALRTDGATR